MVPAGIRCRDAAPSPAAASVSCAVCLPHNQHWTGIGPALGQLSACGVGQDPVMAVSVSALWARDADLEDKIHAQEHQVSRRTPRARNGLPGPMRIGHGPHVRMAVGPIKSRLAAASK